jgi:hypothetical protein
VVFVCFTSDLASDWNSESSLRHAVVEALLRLSDSFFSSAVFHSSNAAYAALIFSGSEPSVLTALSIIAF